MDQLGDFPFLEVSILLPILGALLLALIPEEDTGAVRGAALVTSLVTFAVSVPLFFLYDPTKAGFQLVKQYPWLGPKIGASFTIGISRSTRATTP